jgi:hypothetical protein
MGASRMDPDHAQRLARRVPLRRSRAASRRGPPGDRRSPRGQPVRRRAGRERVPGRHARLPHARGRAPAHRVVRPCEAAGDGNAAVALTIAPDDHHAILVQQTEPTRSDLLYVDLDRGVTSRLTQAPESATAAVFSKDGTQVAYVDESNETLRVRSLVDGSLHTYLADDHTYKRAFGFTSGCSRSTVDRPAPSSPRRRTRRRAGSRRMDGGSATSPTNRVRPRPASRPSRPRGSSIR